MNIENIQFDEKGLVPAIIQDAATKQVLMMAYMNRQSLAKTIESGLTCFYSRSRQYLWTKGETSGNIQRVKEIRYDCDGDTLLIQVEQVGAACHEGTYSCFSRKLGEQERDMEQVFDPQKVYGDESPAAILNELYSTIMSRKNNPTEGSYTCYLFEKGQDKILKKVGEESAETIIASKNMSESEILYEMADLWYHCMVLLAFHGIEPMKLLGELKGRRK